MECACRRITATITAGRSMSASITPSSGISGTLSIRGSHSAPYQGEYVITPSEGEQVLDTSSRLMLDDLVIEPIPSNYGRILWDGSKLTVY